MKKFLLSILCLMLTALNIQAQSTATLTFDDKVKRTVFDTSHQVWMENGITLTNNKGASTSNVADYAKPARFYKNSEVIVEFTSPITKIEFACNTAAYATTLNKSIEGSSLSDKVVTVELDGTSNTYTCSMTEGQVRLDAVTVTYTDGDVVAVPSVSVPVASVAAGVYTAAQSVTFESEYANAENPTISYYYTTDGNEPTKESTLLEGALEVTESCTVKVIAVMTVGEEEYTSKAASYEYIISEAAKFVAVTATEQVVAGKVLLVANNLAAHGLSSNYGYLPVHNVTEVEGGIENAVYYGAFELEVAEGGWYIKDNNGKYLYLTGTYNSFNVSEEIPAEGGVWTIAIAEDGTATITNVAMSKYVQYSTKYTSYGAYAEAQDGGVVPTLYIPYVEPEEPATVVITSVEQLNNNKLYTIVSKDTGRGGMFAGEGATLVDMCGVTYNNAQACHSIERDANDPRQQFAFVNYEGKFYLYSVSEKKFVAKDGNVNKLTAEAPFDYITVALEAESGGDYFSLFINDANYITASPGWCSNTSRNTCIQTTLTGKNQSDGWDDGAWFTITQVGDFDATEALALLSATTEPEAPFEVVAVTPTEAVAELTTVTVEFSEEIEGTFDMMAMTQIYLGTRSNGCSFEVNGKVLTITPFNAINTPGEYKLVIPEGLITRKSNGEAVTMNGEYVFTVKEATVEPEPEVIPAANKSYTVVAEGHTNVSRPQWAINDEGTAFVSTGNTTVSTDAQKQFAFVTYEEAIYIYSISAKKFVMKDASLSDKNPDAVQLTELDNGKFFFKFDADHNVNIGGSGQMTIDWWATIDGGNQFTLTEAGDFDATEALALLNTTPEPEAPFEVVAVTPTEAVEELTTVTVEFSEEIEGTFDMMGMTQIYLGTRSNGCSFEVNGKVLTITPFNAINTPGEYKLVIPEGLITRKSNGEAVTMNGEYVFTVKEAEAPFEVVAVTPTEAVAELTTVTVEFSEEIEGTFDMMGMTQIYLGTRSNGCSFEVNGKVLTITPFNAINTPGEYKLVIPEGLITRKSNGEAVTMNGEYVFTVKEAVVEPERFTVTAALFPTVEGDVTEIKGIRVEAGQGPALAELPTGWTLTNEAGDEFEMNIQWLYDYETVLIMVNPAITEAGTYTLTIPAGSLKTDDGKECEAAEFSWTIKDPYMPYNNGTRTNTGRVIRGITLTAASGENSYTLTDDEQTQDYTDATAVAVFQVEVGEELTISFDKAGEWIHQFVFIDFDGDGFTASIAEGSEWAPAEDLVAYSFYNNDSSSDENGWNSVGTSITGNDRSTPAVPAFKAPYAAGTYRMRVKQDWCNIDPAGDADGKFGDFKANGGQIIDVTLEVIYPIGIESVESENVNVKGIYDITGRKIEKITEGGIYIVNGKKVLVK